MNSTKLLFINGDVSFTNIMNSNLIIYYGFNINYKITINYIFSNGEIFLRLSIFSIFILVDITLMYFFMVNLKPQYVRKIFLSNFSDWD